MKLRKEIFKKRIIDKSNHNLTLNSRKRKLDELKEKKLIIRKYEKKITVDNLLYFSFCYHTTIAKCFNKLKNN